MSLRSSGFWKKLMVRTAAVASGALLVASGFGFTIPKVNAQSTSKVISSSNIRVNEGAGTAVFTLTISDSSFDGTVTVDYFTSDQTATAPQDYTAVPRGKGSVSFPYNPDGPSSVTVSIRVIDDSIVEPSETFSLNISSPQQGQQGVTVAQNSYTATIIDNDPAPTPVTVTPTPSTPTPAPTPTTTITPPRIKLPVIPAPTPEPTPTPDPVVIDEPKVLADTSPTPIPPTPPPPTPQGPERAVFVKSVLSPKDIGFNAKRLAKSGVLAILLILLIMFPADVFNSTLQSNYDEVVGWFKMDRVQKLHQKLQLHKMPITIVLSIFAVLVTLLNTQLSPGFGLNRASMALLLGMFLALSFAAMLYDLSRSWYMKKRFGVDGKLRAHALGLGAGALFVTVSRLAHFVPGYLYGLFTGLIFKQKNPTDEQDGEGLALASTLLIVVAVIGWFALIPIRAAATQPNASFIMLVLESALASLWVSALGTLVFSLMPMRFMYGEQVKKWNKFGWAALYGGGMLLFIYTLLDPNQSVYGKSATTTWVSVISLFVGFGLFSFTFWGYFRYRHLWRHTPDAPVQLS